MHPRADIKTAAQANVDASAVASAPSHEPAALPAAASSELAAECSTLRDQLAAAQAELETTRTRAQEAADELAKLKTGVCGLVFYVLLSAQFSIITFFRPCFDLIDILAI